MDQSNDLTAKLATLATQSLGPRASTPLGRHPRAGLPGKGGASDRFEQLLNDPLLLGSEGGAVAAAEKLLGLGDGEESVESSLFENALTGGMRASVLKALAAAAEAGAGVPGPSGTTGGYEIRQPINRMPVSARLDSSSLGMFTDMSDLRMPVNDLVMVPARVPGKSVDPRYVAEPATALADAAKAGATSNPLEALTGRAKLQQAVLEARLEEGASCPPQRPEDTLVARAERAARASASGKAYSLARLKHGLTPVTGLLSSYFESGDAGCAAIGYDRLGGTSYGTYQISSRSGTMKRFIAFLEDRAPEYAHALKTAGPANTGSTQGAMPRAWGRLAGKDREKFEKLQEEFIFRNNYRPALQAILESTGVNVGGRSPALREVLWSTAVQHGPTGAAKIFTEAMRTVPGGVASLAEQGTDRDVIASVYSKRKASFVSSTQAVRHAVRDRLAREERMALSMLSASLEQEAARDTSA